MSASIEPVQIPVRPGYEQPLMRAALAVPPHAHGLVIYGISSAGSRHAPRHVLAAQLLNDAGLGTLIVDLLVDEEEDMDTRTHRLRFDVHFHTERLMQCLDWARQQPRTAGLRAGLLGEGIVAGAALRAAALRPQQVATTVLVGGRPGAATNALPHVQAPVLFVVGKADDPMIRHVQQTMMQMRTVAHLALLPNISDAPEAPNSLEQVVKLAGRWFTRHLG